MPAGVAHYVNQSGSSVRFEVVQPTTPLPPYLSIDFCNGFFNVTIKSARHNITIPKKWNSTSCNFENGEALINLDVNYFHGGENYTVIFSIPFHFDGVVDLCYLLLEVDDVQILKQSK